MFRSRSVYLGIGPGLAMHDIQKNLVSTMQSLQSVALKVDITAVKCNFAQAFAHAPVLFALYLVLPGAVAAEGSFSMSIYMLCFCFWSVQCLHCCFSVDTQAVNEASGAAHNNLLITDRLMCHRTMCSVPDLSLYRGHHHHELDVMSCHHLTVTLLQLALDLTGLPDVPLAKQASQPTCSSLGYCNVVVIGPEPSDYALASIHIQTGTFAPSLAAMCAC